MTYSLRGVFKGASLYTVGQLLTKGAAILLIPLYTRFLSTVDYGIIGYLEMILQVLTALLALGFYSAQSRYYFEAEGDPERQGSFLFSINLILAVVLAAVTLPLIFFGEPLYRLLSSGEIPFHPYLPLILGTAAIQIMNHMVVTWYLAAREYTKCAILQIVQFVFITIGVVWLVVFKEQGALGKVAGTFWGSLLFLILFFPAYARLFRFRFRREHVVWAVAFGLPLVVHLLAAAIHGFIDRVILERLGPLGDLGLYTLGYQAGLVMFVIVQSVNRAWTPNFYALMSSDHPEKAYEVRRTVAVWMGAVGSVFLIGSLWASEIITLMTPPEYHGAARVVPMVLLGYVFNGIYFFFVAPLFYFKKTRVIPLLTVTSALLNVILNLLLIPRYGILGAAWATAVSFAWLALGAWYTGRRLFDAGYEGGRLLLLLGLLSAVAAAPVWAGMTPVMEGVKVGVLLGWFAVSYLCYRSYLDPIVARLRIRG